MTSPTAALADMFPDSAEAVNIIMRALAIGAQPATDEMEADGRMEAIRGLVESTTSEVRTRVVVITEILRELTGTVRALTMTAKGDAGDPDISEGHAEITADGFLVVFMGEREIARLPYNPRRNDGTAEKLAGDALAEFTRLHALGGLEVANVTKLPATGKRVGVAVLVEDKGTEPTAGE